MAQKIKITATLANKQNQSAQNAKPSEVEYKWRWARVFAALLLVVVVLVLATMYLFPNTKNPKETSQSLTKASVQQGSSTVVKTITSAVNNAKNTDNETEKVGLSQSSTAELPIEKASVTQPAIEQRVELEPSNPTDVDNSEAVVNESVTNNSLSKTAENSDESLEQAVSVDIEQQANENNNADLADIALGAKMNTQSVTRALLSRDIKAREPVDIIGERIARASFTKKLYFFTEVNGLKGKVVRHKWYFQDQLQADVELSIFAERYRTYSSKNIAALQLGEWRVELIADGKTLASKQFKVTDQ
ncbi:hypothetical protein AN214_04134 [Pseudoalteromonas sp. P1-9]|uniref:DUF2914 domain-containing protein n=1 Tax=Pseudoalteromonas sp. P1-9 TaxID=1710354 RepID=UPI0006D63D09|nr:DUF2914 domain-containing protein [Pseudoalteromonas sp. P1-9]KPV93838.1 hypothetical protein AN214_04134 [Pseudoalteromonas sp. P1-9]